MSVFGLIQYTLSGGESYEVLQFWYFYLYYVHLKVCNIFYHSLYCILSVIILCKIRIMIFHLLCWTVTIEPVHSVWRRHVSIMSSSLVSRPTSTWISTISPQSVLALNCWVLSGMWRECATHSSKQSFRKHPKPQTM